MKSGKFFVVLLIHCTVCLFSYAQAPSWIWSAGSGGASNESAYDIVTDASGNVYVTGYFDSPSIIFGSDTLINNGEYDFFLVKFDPSGNVLWTRSTGGSLDDMGMSLCTDLNGNVIVTGFFETVIAFDTTFLVSSGSRDVFVVKYDPAGNVLWAKGAGGSNVDFASGICSDANGNVFVTGQFSSTNITFGSTTLYHTGSGDMFLVKYDSTGNVAWGKRPSSPGSDAGVDVVSDAGGNVLVLGGYMSTITFGSTSLTNAGLFDNFLAKYSPGGTLIWVSKASGPGNDVAMSISLDASDHAYITGSFDGATLQFGSTTLNNAGSNDIFFAKYDSTGAVNWAWRAGGSQYDEGMSVAVDASGNILGTGYFRSTVNFGSFTLNTAGAQDLYVASFDSSGAANWAVRAGGIESERPNGICSSPGGRIFLAGAFSSPTMTFGADTLTSDSGGYGDIFVAAMDHLTGLGQAMEGMESVTIFPNPSQGRFVIQDVQRPIHGFRIYNLMGELVKASDKVASMYEIDLGEEAKGLYLLKVFSGDREINKKILLQ